MSEKSEEIQLIYRNLLNGVPVDSLTRAFHKSEKEVWEIFRVVNQHILNFTWKHKRPHIHCDTLALAKRNRTEIFTTLNFMREKNINLDSSPILKIRSEPVENCL